MFDNYYLIIVVISFIAVAVIIAVIASNFIGRYKKLKKELNTSYKNINYHFFIRSSLLNLTRNIILKKDRNEIFNELTVITEKVFKPDRVSIMLAGKNNHLTLVANKGLGKNIPSDEKIKIGDSISGYVVKNKKPLLINNDSFNFNKNKIQVRKDIQSAMSVPLIVGKELLGVINISLKDRSRVFTKNDLSLFETFSNEISIALKNYQLITKIKENVMQTLKAFVATIDAKDNYTKNHSQNISNVAGLIAYKYGLDDEKTEEIMIAGLVHDIGKIGIPDKILNKHGRLNNDEFEVIKKHPAISADIIGKIEDFQYIVPLILYHHERWDGKGYPSGLKGSKIPIGARILNIADTYDALISNRPYRKALSKVKAIEEIKRNIKSQFDPKLTKIFLKII